MDHADIFRKLKVRKLIHRDGFSKLIRLVNLAVELGNASGRYRFAYCIDRNAFLYIVRTRAASFYVIVDVAHDGPGSLNERHVLNAGFVRKCVQAHA